MKARSIFLIPCALILSAFITSTEDIPFLTGRVTDNAQIMSLETQKLLSDSLKMHEDRTTNQVVILTIPTLHGESIEDYAYRAFNEWKLGQKDKDNGVLIIVVPDDKRMRIEVGYGLDGILTDLTASRIIQDIMTPKFKNGDYDGGITAGTFAVINILEGGYLEEAAGNDDEDGSSTEFGLSGMDSPDLKITERILIGAFIFGIIGLFTIIGILTPGFGWFLYIFLIPFWAMFPIIVVGTNGALVCLISYLIIFPAAKLYLKNKPWYQKAKKDIATKGQATIGGFKFSSGGSGGSWSSGSGSSSGGSSFSGGGGSSGGGGASGGW
ncbi:MAG: YgcG family protein [Bacteroidia bacterium]|nr:MAG: YgcG family protein [Bacteroidia bacterium]